MSLARLGLAALGLALAAGAPAETIERFDVEIALVAADGDFVVEETIVYDFAGEPRHGIFREIPLARGSGWAEEERIEIEVEGVSDGDGVARRVKETRGGDVLRLRIGHPDRYLTGVETYRIRYRVEHAILWLDEHDELYWNATGTEWAVPIAAASARVRLPPELTANEVETRCFTGPRGSTASRCRVDVAGGDLVFRAERALPVGSGLTVAVALPKGVLEPPGAFERFWRRFVRLGGVWLFSPLVALAAMFSLWRRRGRDPQVSAAVTVRYEPPAGLSPAEVGALLDERVDLDDVTSTVIDLAVRGYLRIEELTSERFLFFSSTDWKLIRLREADAALKAHERRMLDGLFASGDEVTVSELKNRFYTRLPGIESAIYAELSGAGRHFVRSPRAVRRLWIGVAVALGVGAFLLTGSGLLRLGAGVALAVSAGIVLLFARTMPKRTRAGRKALDQILGFREFVSRVDRDRLEREGLRIPERFERLLPYALVLGVADAWASVFADLYSAPPEWYRGSAGPFRPGAFVNDLGRTLDTMGRTMSSAPSSSSGGGSAFGGGGFSGGGAGGGGGGSW